MALAGKRLHFNWIFIFRGGPKSKARATGPVDVPGLGGRGWVGGTRRKPRSAARPNRWRLCVRTHARQCLASNALSPMGARYAPSTAHNGPANPPTPPRRQWVGAHGNNNGVQSERWLSQRMLCLCLPLLAVPTTQSVGARQAIPWRDRRAPWMAHVEPPWTGSRRVPTPRPHRPKPRCNDATPLTLALRSHANPAALPLAVRPALH